MSANRTRNTLTRQWELLKLMPSRPPGATARDLTGQLNEEGFAVSKRQVERDLNELAAVFPLTCNNKSSPYGWYWAKGASTELPGFSAAEALSMYLTEHVVRPLLPATVVEVMAPRFQQARRKLDSLTGQSVLPDWAEKVAHVPPMLPQLPPELDEHILETVQTALLHGKQIYVTYHAANKPEPKAYKLHPLGLVQRGVATYIVGRVDPYETPHLFALQRLRAAELLADSVQVPAGFTLTQFLQQGGMQFGNGEDITLKARIAEKLVQSITESPLSETQHIEPDTRYPGWHLLQVKVTESWQLNWWLLSLGDLIEVLEPHSLRQEIKQRLARALGWYEGFY